ncbi:uncharacterized protein LOC128959709 [Oppia nitens]|uniref:uncharacterized protein LOC128959709 n=1 Tax=Oppia nitens TaxID=1686743 RepID=UPI0023DC0D3C|nr:uncharacterized protein LOC128959709 [Oppia nitens]
MFLKFAITYYQYSPHRLTAPEAGHMYTIATVVFSVGEVVNIVLAMYLSINAVGILFAYFPVIMVDMKYILDTDIKLISLQTTFETIGNTVGTFVGLTYKWLNRQIVMAIAFIMMSVLYACTPLLTSLWQLYVIAFLFGVGSTVNISAYIVWTIELWQHRSAPVLQFNALGFGLGTFIGTTVMSMYTTGNIEPGKPLVPVDVRQDRLTVPSIVLCSVLTIVPIVSLVVYIIKPYKIPENSSVSNNFSDNNNTVDSNLMEMDENHSRQQQQHNQQTTDLKLFDDPRSPRILMRVLFTLWFGAYILMETMFLKFAVTYYQYSPHRLTAPEAGHMYSIATVVYSVGEVVNIVLAMYLSINTVVCIHYTLVVVGIVLLIVGHWYLTVLWVASCVLMAGCAPLFPLSVSFTSQYLTFSNTMSNVFQFSRGLLLLITPYIIGEFIDGYPFIFF